jgi:hypothetical protein
MLSKMQSVRLKRLKIMAKEQRTKNLSIHSFEDSKTYHIEIYKKLLEEREKKVAEIIEDEFNRVSDLDNLQH